MAIEPITALGGLSLSGDIVAPDRIAATGVGGVDFLSTIGRGLERVDTSLRTADDAVRALAAGENVPLHDVMIAMERARLDLMLAVEVRNRLVEAYQELNRMQL